jgi:hypothetical protein
LKDWKDIGRDIQDERRQGESGGHVKAVRRAFDDPGPASTAPGRCARAQRLNRVYLTASLAHDGDC